MLLIIGKEINDISVTEILQNTTRISYIFSFLSF